MRIKRSPAGEYATETVPAGNLPSGNDPALSTVSDRFYRVIVFSAYVPRFAAEQRRHVAMGVTKTGSDPRKEQQSVLVGTQSPRAARLLSSALQRLSVSTTVLVNGRSVINYLTARTDAESDRELPALIVLAQTLPDMARETVVHAIKSSPRLRRLPVILLSSDGSPAERDEAYGLGVNAYVTTPDDVEGYVDTIEALATFWFEHATIQV